MYILSSHIRRLLARLRRALDSVTQFTALEGALA
jgi:hypothetical protein